MVTVDLPGAVRRNFPARTARVMSRVDLRARLETGGAALPLEVGVPLVLTFGTGRRRVAATVSGNPSPGAFDVLLTAPPELRQFGRYPLGVHVDVETVGQPESLLLSGEIVDLSIAGARFVVGTALNVGTEVFAVLDLAMSGPAMAIGEVLACVMAADNYSYTARLCFTCISDEHLRRIAAFLDHLERCSGIVPERR